MHAIELTLRWCAGAVALEGTHGVSATVGICRDSLTFFSSPCRIWPSPMQFFSRRRGFPGEVEPSCSGLDQVRPWQEERSSCPTGPKPSSTSTSAQTIGSGRATLPIPTRAVSMAANSAIVSRACKQAWWLFSVVVTPYRPVAGSRLLSDVAHG